MNANVLLERWEKTGLLKGIDDSFKKYALATCLQSQVKFNENKDLDGQWLRASIPVVRRVLAQTRNLFTNRDFENVMEGAVNYHIFKTKFQYFESSGKSNLQAESKYIGEFSDKILSEINNLFRDEPTKEFNFRGFMATENGDFMMFM